MRILFLTAWYPSPENPTTAIYVREHALAASLHHDVLLVHLVHTPGLSGLGVGRGGLGCCRVDPLPEEPVPAVRVRYRLPRLYGAGDWAYCRMVWKAVKELGYCPDVVHVNITLPTGLAGWYVARRFGVPFVLTEHASDFISFHANSWSSRLKTQFILNRSARLLPVSQDMAETMRRVAPAGHYSVVANTINTREFALKQATPVVEIPLVLSIGNLVPRKGYEYLLRAVARVSPKNGPSYLLRIIGNGYLEHQLKVLASELGIEGLVEFVPGEQPRSHLISELQNCAFFVLPSLHEGFGVVLVEAMACGRPVLTTSSGGQREFVTPETGIMVPAGDVEALAEGLVYMLEHWREFDSESIARYARQHFSHETIGKQLNQIYQEVVVASS